MRLPHRAHQGHDKGVPFAEAFFVTLLLAFPRHAGEEADPGIRQKIAAVYFGDIDRAEGAAGQGLAAYF